MSATQPTLSTTVDVATTTAPTTQTTPADDRIDSILLRLEHVGKNLRSFTANVALSETDALTADEFGRIGSVLYDRPEQGEAKLKVDFARKVVADRSQEQRITYLLADGWLTERDYRTKTEVRRQVLRPGETLDLLKLGEGPFPLPIGQDVAQVHRLFIVSIPAADQTADPDLPPPAHSDALRLAPRPNTQFARQFQSIDVWVDQATDMPVRIVTTDASGNVIRTTDLSNIQVNSPIAENQFELPPIDSSWNRHEEPFSE